MKNLKVLFIGGTGVISSASTALAAERGIDLYLLTRGKSPRAVPKGVTLLQGDIRRPEEARKALGEHRFDAVVDWVAFTPEHIKADLDLLRDRTEQYLFISSASAYQTPLRSWPVRESTPLHNPWWEYSRNKIACEELLLREYRERDFPAVIIRPSHTYDQTLLPFHGGYTTVSRMKRGRPVIVHGDGSSLWTLTHHRDFAVGLVGLLGNPNTRGEAFHITSDEALTWDQITRMAGRCIGIDPEIVHVPSDLIARHDPEWGASLLGDKTWSLLFDNSKIRRFVPDFQPRIPFSQGIREIMAWHEADPARQGCDEELDALMDTLAARMLN